MLLFHQFYYYYIHMSCDKLVHLDHLVSGVLKERGAQLETKVCQDLQGAQPQYHSNSVCIFVVVLQKKERKFGGE